MKISAKIDVKKVSKGDLYEGKKGTYLNILLVEQKNEYSDGYIVQELGKDRRERGERGAILGNWSYLRGRGVSQDSGVGDVSGGDGIPF